jgi:mannose-6-phosphate isomerase-like protein (cupin superfamily)
LADTSERNHVTGRRVIVTKIDRAGRSGFDEHLVSSVVPVVDPNNPVMQSGKIFTLLWGTPPTSVPLVGPGVDDPPHRAPLWAEPGGTRVVLATFPPLSPSEATTSQGVEAKFPELISAFDPDGSGMHATDTIDYVMVLSGSLTLELDDGAKVGLHVGDTVIQRGTRHAWRNYSPEPATVIGFSTGAKRIAGSEGT